MNIEVGKYYKTRSGRKAYICGVSPFAADFGFAGYVEGETTADCWLSDGCYTRDSHVCESSFDLVAEWVEPLAVECWVRVYKDHGGKRYASDITWPTRQQAIDAAPGCTSVVRLTGVEEPL